MKLAYHWTHRDNLASIEATGIDPTYSEGKLSVSWVCEGRRVGWACCHVSNRHGWDADDMVLLRLEVTGVELKRTCNRGVFTSAAVITPDRIVMVRMRQDGPWLCPDQTPKNTQPVGT